MKQKSPKHTQILQSKNFDELLDIQYGARGTKDREGFEQRAHAFIIAEIDKDKTYTLAEIRNDFQKIGFKDI